MLRRATEPAILAPWCRGYDGGVGREALPCPETRSRGQAVEIADPCGHDAFAGSEGVCRGPAASQGLPVGVPGDRYK